MHKDQVRNIVKELLIKEKSSLAEKSKIISTRLLELDSLKKSKSIFLYNSLEQEVDTKELIKVLVDTKILYLPKIQYDEMGVVRINEQMQYKEGMFGILEPQGNFSEDKIDIAIVPLLACDVLCHRVGKGKGYYDKFFANNKDIYKIGLAFDFQMMEETILMEAHDVRMDCIVTDTGVFYADSIRKI